MHHEARSGPDEDEDQAELGPENVLGVASAVCWLSATPGGNEPRGAPGLGRWTVGCRERRGVSTQSQNEIGRARSGGQSGPADRVRRHHCTRHIRLLPLVSLTKAAGQVARLDRGRRQLRSDDYTLAVTNPTVDERLHNGITLI